MLYEIIFLLRHTWAQQMMSLTIELHCDLGCGAETGADTYESDPFKFSDDNRAVCVNASWPR
jgi:hypothetical protein